MLAIQTPTTDIQAEYKVTTHSLRVCVFVLIVQRAKEREREREVCEHEKGIDVRILEEKSASDRQTNRHYTSVEITFHR